MNKFLMVCASLFCALVTDAQSIKDVFVSSPDTIFESVDSVNRAKIIQSEDEDRAVVASTIFGDTIDVKEITDDYMSFAYSNANVEIKLIDDIIVVVTTLEDINSEVAFYDRAWNIKSKWIYGSAESDCMPDDDDIKTEIIEKPDTMDSKKFERLVLYFDPLLVKAELSAVSKTITLSPKFVMLTKEEKKEVTDLLKPKTFKWTNGRFK